VNGAHSGKGETSRAIEASRPLVTFVHIEAPLSKSKDESVMHVFPSCSYHYAIMFDRTPIFVSK
jgi:hypothetical protein